MVIFYDGWCPLCRSAKERLTRLDRGGRLQFHSLRDAGVAAELGIPPETLASRMHVQQRLPDSETAGSAGIKGGPP